jgi:hypothetical protein
MAPQIPPDAFGGMVSYHRVTKDAEPFQRRDDIRDLKAFLAFGQGDELNDDFRSALDFWLPRDEKKRKQLRVELKKGLDRFFKGLDSNEHEPDNWEVEVKGQLTVRLKRWGLDDTEVHYFGDSSTTFLLRAVQVLKDYGQLVHECERRGCGRLFVVDFQKAGRRQSYCSTRCSQHARLQRFREKLTPDQLREMRHQEYLAKIKKSQGPKAVHQVRRYAARKNQS